MITKQEKDAALTVLADYIAQNDINMVGGVFENDVMGEFIVTYGRESALQKLQQDKKVVVKALSIAHEMHLAMNKAAYTQLPIYNHVMKLLEKHK